MSAGTFHLSSRGAKRRRWRQRQVRDADARRVCRCRGRRESESADRDESHDAADDSAAGETVTLRGLSRIVAKRPAESFAASNRSECHPDWFRLDDRVVESLVIPLRAVVPDLLPDGAAQRFLAEEDHPVEALRLDGPHESLDPSARVRGARREANPSLAELFEQDAVFLAKGVDGDLLVTIDPARECREEDLPRANRTATTSLVGTRPALGPFPVWPAGRLVERYSSRSVGNPGKRPKSRSSVRSPRAPASRHTATICASKTRFPTAPASRTACVSNSG